MSGRTDQDPNENGVQAPAAEDVVRARSFELVDGSGRARMRLSVNEGDGPLIEMLDDSGRARVQMGIQEEGSLIQLVDEEGTERLGLVARRDGTAGMVLMRDRGIPAVVVRTGEQGIAAVEIHREDGSRALELSIGPIQEPVIHLLGRQGHTLVELAAADGGNAYLALANPDKEPGAHLWLAPDGATGIAFNDREKRARVMVGVDESDEPHIDQA